MNQAVGRPLILIVDDAPLNLRLLSECLVDTFEVLVATCGADALQLVASTRPELVLLDVTMPDMDGYEVCRRLKEEPSSADIPVIFITGREAEEDEIKGLSLGAVDYITKPFSPAIVVARVKTHIELKRCRDQLEALALQDGLTGLPNRRRFETFLEACWGQAQRGKSPVSVIMVDVDHFKAYNDHHGHLAGDECLRKVARALRSTRRRESDLVARYGGEEFVMVLPGTDGVGAQGVAEAMRQAVLSASIAHAASGVAPHVTISLGTATIVPDPESTPEALVRWADDALYSAKRAGRNRVRQHVGADDALKV